MALGFARWRLLTTKFKKTTMTTKNKTSNEAHSEPSCKTGVISRFSIPETLELIKQQTGLDLELCDYFTGVRRCNDRSFFNVILSKIISESEEYIKLKRFADKYELISVEPNGLNRVAVFQNGL